MSEAETQAKKPVKTFRAGGVEASVWENEAPEGGGTRRSVSVRKRYRDKQGNWKDSTTFFANDLPCLALVAQKAFEHLALNESADEENTPV